MPNNLNTPFSIYQKIHFIGIGGIGISALARILKQNNHQISGSDQYSSENTKQLIDEGIKVKIGHSLENIPKDCDLVIYTIAIPESNSELIQAKKMNCTILTYPEAIGLLTKQMFTIAISGTHGKTTTTAMTGMALVDLGFDPTIIVGSLIPQLNNKNERIGNSNILVLEACEYQESFLNYHPDIILLNNIDPEHFDYFKNEKNYLNAFKNYIKKLKPNGKLIVNGDDQNVKSVIKDFPGKIISFGQKTDNDFILKQKTINNRYNLSLKIPGQHNLLNATAAFSILSELNASQEKITPSLNNYLGANRRFEIKSTFQGKDIIDDYGHTPTEISATLKAVKEKYGADARILCIFQPHQYSRTRIFLNEFSHCFNDCFKVLIPNIYESRDSEEDKKSISVDILVASINKNCAGLSENSQNFENTIITINKYIEQADVIIFIGAGDITKLASRYSMMGTQI